MRVAPKTSLNVCEPAPNSGVLVLPMITAPAARRRSTIRLSAVGHVVGEQRRAVRRPHPGGVLEVLDRDRQALQRTGRRGVGERERLLAVEQRDDRVHARVALLDAVEEGSDHLARGDLAAADGRGEIRRGPPPHAAGLY